MFGFFTKRNTTLNPTITPMTNTYEPTVEHVLSQFDGKYHIVETDGVVGTTVASYTRKADAVRGAARKGITLTNV